METAPTDPKSTVATEMFPLGQAVRIARDWDRHMRDEREDMALTNAIVQTRFWDYWVGWGKRTNRFAWKWNGTEIEVNRLRRAIRTYLAALYPRSSRVVCEPDPHGRGEARITQAVLNAWWRKPYAYPTVDDVLMQALLFPGSGFKVGYDPGTANPIERTWLRPVPPWELVLDRDAPSLEDERYRGHLYQAPMQEVEQRYPQLRGKLTGTGRRDFFDTDPGDSTATAVGSNTEHMSDSTSMHVDRYVRVLEFCNLRDPFVASSGEVYRGRLEVYVLDQGALSEKPVVVTPLPFADADGRELPHVEPLILDHEAGFPLRAVAPARVMIPQQVELNLLRTAAAGDVRRNARKGVYRDGALNQDELDKLMDGVDMHFAKVPQETPLNEAIKMLEHQPIAADTLQYAAIVERDLDRASGPSANAQGVTTNVTAYEVQTVQLFTEEEIKYHALMLLGTLARVTRLAQRAILGAGGDRGDSEGGEIVGEVSEVGMVDTGTMSQAPQQRQMKWEPFVIMDGEERLTVTPEALDGDFPITFVEADSTPVNRQAQLQFMTGPGLQGYMALWDVVQNGGPMALLAEVAMQRIAESMNLPKDMHPSTLLSKLKAEEAKAKKAPPPPKAAAAAMGGPAPAQGPAPAPAQPPPGDGTSKLVNALGNAAQAVAGTPAESMLVAAMEAAQAGDLAGLAAAVGAALEAGVPPEVEAVLVRIQEAIGGVAAPAADEASAVADGEAPPPV